MIQIIEQTDEQKMLMYMKLPKKEIIEMLIEANKHLTHFSNNQMTYNYKGDNLITGR